MLVDRNRLIQPDDDLQAAFPSLGFRNTFRLQTSGEPVLLTDPMYLADVHNSHDEVAAFLRAHGVFLMGFGGDASCPVWWEHPFVLLPISLRDAYLEPPEEATVLVDEVGCDSGSFIFLPLTDTLPQSVQLKVDEVLSQDNGAALGLPGGK